MFRFAHPLFLYILLIIPVIILVYWYICRLQKKRIKQIGDPKLIAHLMPEVSYKRKHLKFGIMMLILALLTLLIARPQTSQPSSQEVTHKGIEAIIAIDVSNSMLCQDVSPSRLTKSKMLVSKLTEKLDNDKVGLIAFAGTAITILPLTVDGVSAKMYLDQLSTSTISTQGTNLAEAIECAGRSFSKNKNVCKALILITDAEDNEQGAVEAAKQLAESGIRIFVLSVGTTEGGAIPLGNGELKKDSDDKVIITHLNEQVGQEIAKAANGVYIHVTSSDQAQNKLMAEIDKMQTEEYTFEMYAEHEELFMAVAIVLLICIILETCIISKKNPLLKNFKVFK